MLFELISTLFFPAKVILSHSQVMLGLQFDYKVLGCSFDNYGKREWAECGKEKACIHPGQQFPSLSYAVISNAFLSLYGLKFKKNKQTKNKTKQKNQSQTSTIFKTWWVKLELYLLVGSPECEYRETCLYYLRSGMCQFLIPVMESLIGLLISGKHRSDAVC